MIDCLNCCRGFLSLLWHAMMLSEGGLCLYMGVCYHNGMLLHVTAPWKGI